MAINWACPGDLSDAPLHSLAELGFLLEGGVLGLVEEEGASHERLNVCVSAILFIRQCIVRPRKPIK